VQLHTDQSWSYLNHLVHAVPLQWVVLQCDIN
jgi:hypothetical protein